MKHSIIVLQNLARMDLTVFNNTLTSTRPFFPSSVVFMEETKSLPTTNYSYSELAVTLFDYGYLYSIELKRNEVKRQLEPYFECEGHNEELDFLSSNSDLLKLLPNLGKYLINRINKGDKMSLELLKEDDSWITLFININTTLSWESANKIFEDFFDNLFELFPILAKKLNINFIPV
jgi:hypothetical protein